MKKKKVNRVKIHDFFVISILFFMMFFMVSTGLYAKKNSISFDYCNFKIENEAKTNMEIYCQFSHSQLTFLKNDSGFTATTEINVILYDDNGDFVNEIFVERDVFEKNYNNTIDFGKKTLVQFNFEVEPGEYQVHLKIEDQYSGSDYELKKDVVAKPFRAEELSISDIEVAGAIEPSDEETNFVKNGRKVLANPTHHFDAESQNVKFYFEIYNLCDSKKNLKNTFQFSYDLKNSQDEVVRKYVNSYPKPYHSTSIDFAIPVKNMKSDTYELEVNIIDEDTKSFATKSTTFSVTKSPLDFESDNYDEVLAMLRMIAEKNEIAKFKKVAMSDRKHAVKKFWQSKDPSPGTAENELMVEFYSRIDYANRHFSTPHIKGWKTNRGKIFIKHGKPDRVTRSIPMAGWIRYEKWEYYTKNRMFVFNDRFGFGNYTIVNGILY